MSRKLKLLNSKLSRYERVFRSLKAQEAKGPLNDYQKSQLKHYRNLLKEGAQNIQKEELRIETKSNKARLTLAQEIESDKELLASLSNTKGVTSMNERQIRAQEKNVQKRLNSNQTKFDKIDFSEGKAKFNNQGDQFRFSSPEGRYVFKDNAEQLRFESNMTKAGIATLPNFNTGTGVVETPKGDNIDLTQTTNTPKEQTKVQQAVTPDVKSEVKPNRAALKSDIFTLDKDGKPLGVMTRGQRRRWEAANQDTMAANIKKLKIGDRTYANRVGSG